MRPDEKYYPGRAANRAPRGRDSPPRGRSVHRVHPGPSQYQSGQGGVGTAHPGAGPYTGYTQEQVRPQGTPRARPVPSRAGRGRDSLPRGRSVHRLHPGPGQYTGYTKGQVSTQGTPRARLVHRVHPGPGQYQAGQGGIGTARPGAGQYTGYTQGQASTKQGREG